MKWFTRLNFTGKMHKHFSGTLGGVPNSQQACVPIFGYLHVGRQGRDRKVRETDVETILDLFSLTINFSIFGGITICTFLNPTIDGKDSTFFR